MDGAEHEPLPAPDAPMVALDRLSKSFKGRPALSDLSLQVPRGTLFGLLGHNGAGKSTTFGLLLGQLFPDAGTAKIRGLTAQTERERALRGVGAIFETPGFYDYLSGWRNLRLLAAYSGKVDRAEMEEAVKLVGLEPRIHDPVRTYSHGMRQRLALAQALVPRPGLLLLDEPTEGLDPGGIHEIRNLVQRLNRDHGMTVVLSSHLLSEVELLCDHVAILNRGKLVFDGEWAALGGSRRRFRLDLSDWEKAVPILQGFSAELLPECHLDLPPDTDVAEVVEKLVRAGIRVRAVEPVRRSLEQIYLETIAAE